MEQLNITNNVSESVRSISSSGLCYGAKSTSETFARQSRKEQQPDNSTGLWNAPKPRIGKGRPFTPSQKWTVNGDIATCIVEPGIVATIDAADIKIADGHRWYILPQGKNNYVATGQGFLLHRMILGMKRGDPRVDHRDCDALNCRRNNLRIASQTNNMANRRKHKHGTTTYKGVFKRKNQTKFSAAITKTIDGKKHRFHLGQFVDPVEAARAYDRKAIELFGEFARLNFPAVEQGRAA